MMMRRRRSASSSSERRRRRSSRTRHKENAENAWAQASGMRRR